MALFYIIPNTDRLITSWTKVPSGATSHWSCVNDPVGSSDENTTYIQNTASVHAYFTGPSFNINSRINSFSIFTRARTNNVNNPYRSSIRIGSTDYPGINRTTTVYTNYTDTWAVNPASNMTWTISDINSLWFGGYGNFIYGNKGSSVVIFTQIYGIVDYTAQSGSILLCQ